MVLLHLVAAVAAFLGTITKRWLVNRWRTFYGSNAVLKPPRDCTTLGSSMRCVGLIDITVGNATRLGASQRSATLRVAPHRYATLEPLGKPGGSRAFSADGPPQSPVAPRRLPQPAGG